MKEVLVLKGQQFYKAGIYCRLSRDDETRFKSVSISTQKAMITKYVQENGWEIVDYYIDDGASGFTFQRPDFIRMVNDIDRKQINMVVTNWQDTSQLFVLRQLRYRNHCFRQKSGWLCRF